MLAFWCNEGHTEFMEITIQPLTQDQLEPFWHLAFSEAIRLGNKPMRLILRTTFQH